MPALRRLPPGASPDACLPDASAPTTAPPTPAAPMAVFRLILQVRVVTPVRAHDPSGDTPRRAPSCEPGPQRRDNPVGHDREAGHAGPSPEGDEAAARPLAIPSRAGEPPSHGRLSCQDSRCAKVAAARSPATRRDVVDRVRHRHASCHAPLSIQTDMTGPHSPDQLRDRHLCAVIATSDGPPPCAADARRGSPMSRPAFQGGVRTACLVRTWQDWACSALHGEAASAGCRSRRSVHHSEAPATEGPTRGLVGTCPVLIRSPVATAGPRGERSGRVLRYLRTPPRFRSNATGPSARCVRHWPRRVPSPRPWPRPPPSVRQVEPSPRPHACPVPCP